MILFKIKMFPYRISLKGAGAPIGGLFEKKMEYSGYRPGTRCRTRLDSESRAALSATPLNCLLVIIEAAACSGATRLECLSRPVRTGCELAVTSLLLGDEKKLTVTWRLLGDGFG